MSTYCLPLYYTKKTGIKKEPRTSRACARLIPGFDQDLNLGLRRHPLGAAIRDLGLQSGLGPTLPPTLQRVSGGQDHLEPLPVTLRELVVVATARISGAALVAAVVEPASLGQGFVDVEEAHLTEIEPSIDEWQGPLAQNDLNHGSLGELGIHQARGRRISRQVHDRLEERRGHGMGISGRTGKNRHAAILLMLAPIAQQVCKLKTDCRNNPL